MNNTTYYARRYRTLYSPNALNFAPSAPRQAMAAVYSPAPTGIHCGLPRGVAARGNPRIALALLAPVALGKRSRSPIADPLADEPNTNITLLFSSHRPCHIPRRSAQQKCSNATAQQCAGNTFGRRIEEETTA